MGKFIKSEAGSYAFGGAMAGGALGYMRDRDVYGTAMLGAGIGYGAYRFGARSAAEKIYNKVSPFVRGGMDVVRERVMPRSVITGSYVGGYGLGGMNVQNALRRMGLAGSPTAMTDIYSQDIMAQAGAMRVSNYIQPSKRSARQIFGGTSMFGGAFDIPGYPRRLTVPASMKQQVPLTTGRSMTPYQVSLGRRGLPASEVVREQLFTKIGKRFGGALPAVTGALGRQEAIAYRSSLRAGRTGMGAFRTLFRR